MAGIPILLKIAGLEYEVILADNLIIERGNTGECNTLKQTISLERANRPDKQKEVLLHEILEAINGHYNIGMDHHQLSLVSVAINAVLVDNEHLRKYFLA